MVTNGQRANANTFNTAFMSRIANTSTTGKIALQNTSDVNSGYFAINIQRYLNTMAQAIGLTYSGDGTAEADASANTYGSTSNAVPNATKFKAAIKLLSDKFAALVANGGHSHDGTDGNGPKILVENLDGNKAGSVALGSSVGSGIVTFGAALASAAYVVVACISNATDSDPIFLQVMPLVKSTTGFTYKLSASTDSANYILEYVVMRAV